MIDLLTYVAVAVAFRRRVVHAAGYEICAKVGISVLLNRAKQISIKRHAGSAIVSFSVIGDTIAFLPFSSISDLLKLSAEVHCAAADVHTYALYGCRKNLELIDVVLRVTVVLDIGLVEEMDKLYKDKRFGACFIEFAHLFGKMFRC